MATAAFVNCLADLDAAISKFTVRVAEALGGGW